MLTDLLLEDFSLELSTYAVGPHSLATRKLRAQLRDWIDRLDPDTVSAAIDATPAVGFDRLPEFHWIDGGWSLVFHAIPLGEWARGVPRPALGMMGPGEATLVDNVTGLKRVIESKMDKYGPLDAPLVIAVQSRTEIPTRDYEVERALYGASTRRPVETAAGDGCLIEEGLWIGRGGWQNSEIPEVITIYELEPWSVASSQPRCWTTLQPQVRLPEQPPWLAPMIIGAEAAPGSSDPLGPHFGLSEHWPMQGDPDFDLS